MVYHQELSFSWSNNPETLVLMLSRRLNHPSNSSNIMGGRLDQWGKPNTYDFLTPSYPS